MNRMQKYFRKGKSKMEIINRRSKCKDGRAIVVHNKGIVIGKNDLKEDIEKDSTESSDSEDDEEQQFGVGTSKKNKNIEVSNEEEITIGNMVVENCNDEKENKRMKRKKNSRDKSLVRKGQKRQREETMIAKTTGKKQSKSNKRPYIIVKERLWKSHQKINHYCRTRVIRNILAKLGERELECMEVSQFGKFLRFSIKTIPQQVLLQLIKRQYIGEKNDELVFRFGSKFVRFGLKDFAIITGMYCHNYPSISDEDKEEAETNIGLDIFYGSKVIRKGDVEKKFKSMKDLDIDITVKMAKLYLLECFVLGKHENTKVNFKTIRMLDTEECFENYPWGRVAYEMTIKSFIKAFAKNDRDTIVLNGFPYAVLIWAFEIFLDLSKESNKIVEQIGNCFTKMLNWKVLSHRVDRLTLDEKVFNKPLVLMKHMKTTKEEEEEEDNMEFFLLKENKSKYKRDDEEKEEGKNLMDEIERIKEGQREIMKQNEDIILIQHGNLVEVMAMLKQLSNEVHNIQGILNSDFMKKEESSGRYSDNFWDDEEFIFQIDSNVKNYLIEKDIKLQKEREKQMLEVASKETTTEDFYLKQELMIERLVKEIKAQEEATTEEKLCMDETIKQDEAMLFSFEDEVVKDEAIKKDEAMLFTFEDELVKDETMMMTFEDRVVKEKEMILSFKDIVGEVCKQAETKDASNGMKIDMTLDKMLKKTTNYMELPNFDIGID